MEDLRLIGLRIKEIRKKQKISQEQLAENIGINYRTVLRIENGHTFPTLQTLVKISKALKCSVSEFFEIAHLKPRYEIISDIINKLNDFSDKELQNFYITFCLL